MLEPWGGVDSLNVPVLLFLRGQLGTASASGGLVVPTAWQLGGVLASSSGLGKPTFVLPLPHKKRSHGHGHGAPFC